MESTPNQALEPTAHRQRFLYEQNYHRKERRAASSNITIDSQFVILDRSLTSADAVGSPGGNVKISTDTFLNSDSLITASPQRSMPGTIDIQASITDVSGSLAQLSEAVLQATSLLQQSCAAKFGGGKTSSLVVGGRDGSAIKTRRLYAQSAVSAEKFISTAIHDPGNWNARTSTRSGISETSVLDQFAMHEVGMRQRNQSSEISGQSQR